MKQWLTVGDSSAESRTLARQLIELVSALLRILTNSVEATAVVVVDDNACTVQPCVFRRYSKLLQKLVDPRDNHRSVKVTTVTTTFPNLCVVPSYALFCGTVRLKISNTRHLLHIAPIHQGSGYGYHTLIIILMTIERY